MNSSNIYAAKILSQSAKISDYFRLQEVNDSLMHENAALIESRILQEYSTEILPTVDSTLLKYNLIPAIICNNTVHLRNNHITLCKGSREGIRRDMGVISGENGVVGIVRNVSPNFAHVISILNPQTRISCAVKRRNTHGNLVWKNMDPQRMTLEAIPKHQIISIGDTIITSGYSTIFPKGILVGKIESFTIVPGSNSYEITVKLFSDISRLKYAYVIKNSLAAEQLSLESEVNTE